MYGSSIVQYSSGSSSNAIIWVMMPASKTYMENYNDGNLDNDDETLIDRSINNVVVAVATTRSTTQKVV